MRKVTTRQFGKTYNLLIGLREPYPDLIAE